MNDIDRGKRRKIPAVDQIIRSVGGVPDRHWTDPRDGVGWMLWLETAGDTPVLAFGSEGNTHKVEVDFGQNAGTVFEIALENGSSTPVVWINDDD